MSGTACIQRTNSKPFCLVGSWLISYFGSGRLSWGRKHSWRGGLMAGLSFGDGVVDVGLTSSASPPWPNGLVLQRRKGTVSPHRASSTSGTRLLTHTISHPLITDIHSATLSLLRCEMAPIWERDKARWNGLGCPLLFPPRPSTQVLLSLTVRTSMDLSFFPPHGIPLFLVNWKLGLLQTCFQSRAHKWRCGGWKGWQHEDLRISTIVRFNHLPVIGYKWHMLLIVDNQGLWSA